MITYPCLLREDEFCDVLEVVQVDDAVDRWAGVQQGKPTLLFLGDLFDNLRYSAGINDTQAGGRRPEG